MAYTVKALLITLCLIVVNCSTSIDMDDNSDSGEFDSSTPGDLSSEKSSNAKSIEYSSSDTDLYSQNESSSQDLNNSSQDKFDKNDSSTEESSSDTVLSSETNNTTSSSSQEKVTPVEIKAFDKIEAEDYSKQNDTQAEGTTAIGWFNADSYLMYENIEFGDETAQSIIVSLAKEGSSGTIEVRTENLDGPVITTFQPSGTNGWEDYQEQGFIVTPISGTQTIYIIGTSGTGIANFDYFQFTTAAAPATPSDLTLTVAGDNTIVVDWFDNAPDELGYKIYYSGSSTKPSAAQQDIEADATSITLENLSAGTNYTIWVEAYNDIASSDAISDTAKTTGEPPEFFTFVTIPDTQEHFKAPDGTNINNMYDWIIRNRDILNIKFVSHLGDVVAYGNRNWEWERTAAPVSKLDGIVPYAVNVGNHDGGDGSDDSPAADEGIKSTWWNGGSWNQRQKFDEYFPLSKLQQQPGWGGNYPEGKTYNSYQYFEAAGMEFMIVHVELKGYNNSIDWAKGIVAANPNKRVIVSSHDQHENMDVFWGVAQPYDNVFMAVCGHSCGREAYGLHTTPSGNPIHRFMSDYQCSDPYAGSLRYYTFYPSENRIEVKTIHTAYNNLMGKYEVDPDSDFDVEYNMQ